MIHVLIIVACLTLFVDDQIRGANDPLPAGPVTLASLTLGSMAITWIMYQVVLSSCRRRLDVTGDVRVLRIADRTAQYYRLCSGGLFICGVLLLGWLRIVRLWVGDLILVDEAIALMPLILMLAAGMWSMEPIERRLREALIVRHLDEGRPVYAGPSRVQHVWMGLRQQVLFILVPILTLLAWAELLYRVAARVQMPVAYAPDGTPLDLPAHLLHDPRPSWARALPGWITEPQALSFWVPALQIAGVVLVFAMMPLALKTIIDTVPLAQGELRDRLAAMCARYRVGVRDLLIWRTHGTMINGAVLGLVAPVRYIMLTDALVDRLDDDQLEAVAAHEVGHIRHRHMIWLGLTLLSAVLLTGAVAGWVVRAIGADAETSVIGVLGVSAASLVAALMSFGFVSRRFEWQADAFAAVHLSQADEGPPAPHGTVTQRGVDAMAGALLRVARLNSIPLNKPSWRHGSIRTRTERLQTLLGATADTLPIHAQARWCKIAVVCTFGLALGAVGFELAAGMVP